MRNQRGRKPRTSKLPAGIILPAMLLCLLCAAPARAAHAPLQPGWNLAALPAPPAPADSDSLNGKIFALDGFSYKAVAPEDVIPGHGYWIFSSTARDIPLTAAPLQTGQSVTVSLSRGWNAVGNPYAVPLSRGDNITAVSGGDAPGEPAAASCIQPEMFTFDPQTGAYVLLPGDAPLAPYQAIVVRALRDCVIRIAFAPAQAAATITVAPFEPESTGVDPLVSHRAVAGQIVIAADDTAIAEQHITALGGRVAGSNPALGILQVELPAGVSDAEFTAQLSAAGVSIDAVPNLIFEAAALPDDPAFHDADQDNDRAFEDIRAPEAWDAAAGAPEAGTIIAVLDTGLAPSHEEFTGRVVTGANFVLPGGHTTDNNGHGTAAAGLAAALGNNSAGAAGVCWTCRVMPVKVLTDGGLTSAFAVLAGIIHAADSGARVISLSLSGPNDHGLWELKFTEAVEYARARGAVVVAAAGNHNADAGEFLPGAVPGCITVGAVDNFDARAAYSNYGAAVDVAAPGGPVLAPRPGGYDLFSGTSAAAPFVAGLAGLLLESNPGMTPAQVDDAILTTARAITPDRPLGAGIIDAAAAMGAPPPDPDVAQPPAPDSPTITWPVAGPVNSLDIRFRLRDQAVSLHSVRPRATIMKSIVETSSLLSTSYFVEVRDATGAVTYRRIIQNPKLLFGDVLTPSGEFAGAVEELEDPLFHVNAPVDVDATELTLYGPGNAVLHVMDLTPWRTGLAMGAMSPPPWTVDTLLYNGDPATRIDIVIMGDGYTAAEQALFQSDADAAINFLLNSVSPFSDYKSYFNVYRVNAISNQSGVDQPPGIYRDTALNCTYTYIMGRYLPICDGATVMEAADLAPGNDVRMVLINDTIYGGTGASSQAVASNALNMSPVMAHEFGHTFGGLHDEYNYNETTLVDPNGPNCDIPSPDPVWQHWIDAGTPGIGVYAVCGFSNLFRPTGTCMMRSSGAPFCKVCKEHLIKLIHEMVPTIQGHSPSGPVSLRENEQQLYSVTIMHPISHNLKVQWLLDGNPIPGATGETFNAEANVIGTGNYILTARVYDDTDDVLSDPYEYLVETREWYLEIILVDGPTNAQGSVSCEEVTLTWDPIPEPGFDRYLVKRSLTPGGPYTLIDDDIVLTTYTDTVPLNDTYYYVVRGYKSSDPSVVTGRSDEVEATVLCNFNCPGYVVTNADPDGPGSFFSCLTEANDFSTPQTITFGISGATIQPTETYILAQSAGADTIDATGKNIVLDGTNCPDCDGLEIHATGSTVLGLSVVNYPDNDHYGIVVNTDDVTISNCRIGTDFSDTPGIGNKNGIRISGSGNMVSDSVIAGNLWAGLLIQGEATRKSMNNKIQNNYIGTTSTGLAALPNIIGVDIRDYSENNLVGGAMSLSQGNLISGNSNTGLRIAGDYASGAMAEDNIVQGNLIGLNKNGDTALPNDYSGALIYFNTNNNLIGGDTLDVRNIISGNNDDGVFLSDATNNFVRGNYIGLNRDGDDVVPNAHNGIYINRGSGNMIGGPDPGQGNYIGGNGSAGITFGDNAIGHTAQGNIIGVLPDGVSPAPNTRGVLFWNSASNNTVGAITGEPNVIANNSGDGVWIDGTGNTITGNRIFNSTDRGIRSPYDFDQEITTATANGPLYDVSGTSSCDSCTVELFRVDDIILNVDPDTSTTPPAGEAFEYLGTTSTDNLGDWDLTGVAVSGGGWVTITITDTNGNTSEFAPNVLLPVSPSACVGWRVTDAGESGAGTLRACIDEAALVAGQETIEFTISNATLLPTTTYDIPAGAEPFTIDATGQNIIIDGTNCPNCDGFTVNLDGAEIKGLAVVNFDDANRYGINVKADNVKVRDCRIGTNFDDDIGLGNRSGILTYNSDGEYTNNVISGNIEHGIILHGYTASGGFRNTLTGNKIGVTTDGMSAMGNGGHGIYIQGKSQEHTIGGSMSGGLGNIIGNNNTGVYSTGLYARDTVFQGNLIGVAADGKTPMPNTYGLSFVSIANNNTIGGSTSDLGNVISGNTSHGVFMDNGIYNTLTGNIIGLNRDGDEAVPNGGAGIMIDDGQTINIGDVTLGNIISGNGTHGIASTNTTQRIYIYNNKIGVMADGQTPAPNSGHGVYVDGTSKYTNVGKVDKPNQIAFNQQHGVMFDPGLNMNMSNGNRIYENMGMGISSTYDCAQTITSITPNGPNFDISGTSSCIGGVVELFRVDNPPDVGQDTATTPARGEAYEFLATTSTNFSNGDWSFTDIPVTGGNYVTVTITRSGNTTGFSKNELLPTGNHDPVITLAQASDDDISFFDVITLTAVASDPDGDPLTYEWSNGVMSPFTATTAAQTDWAGPLQATTAQLTVTVRDGNGGEASAVVPVRVGVKDMAQLSAHPDNLTIAAGNSQDYTFIAQFTTGHALFVIPESATALNGLGTIDTAGHFSAVTPGQELLEFKLGSYTKQVRVTIY